MVCLEMQIQVRLLRKDDLTAITFVCGLSLLRFMIGRHVAEVVTVLSELDAAVLAGVNELALVGFWRW